MSQSATLSQYHKGGIDRDGPCVCLYGRMDVGLSAVRAAVVLATEPARARTSAGFRAHNVEFRISTGRAG